MDYSLFVVSEGETDLEGLHERPEGDGDADDAKEDAQEDDKTIVGHSAPVEGRAFQFQVEITGPDEGEHRAREGADKAHQNGEMRDGDGHDGGEDDQADSESQAPHFQFTIQGPHGGEYGVRTSFE